MYRSRLRNDLSGITLDYVSSIDDDSEIALYDIIGSQAHTLMLYQKNIITKNDAKKILLALKYLKKEKFDSSSGAEDIHELIESLVIKKAGMASGGKMHTARSRNDQVALDIRMKIRDDINIICNCLLDTIEALVSVAKNHQKTIMPLYTHLQQAQAGLFSHYLLAHADVLSRDFQRLYGTFERVNQSPLGAGPIGGTSLPIDRHSTAKMLGFDDLVENSIDATSNEQGKIFIKLRKEGSQILLFFEDNGKGIKRNNWNNIFKPGFSTKKRGWGLGLSFAKRIIEEYHNGNIKVLKSDLGKGTTFGIKLRKV